MPLHIPSPVEVSIDVPEELFSYEGYYFDSPLNFPRSYSQYVYNGTYVDTGYSWLSVFNNSWTCVYHSRGTQFQLSWDKERKFKTRIVLNTSTFQEAIIGIGRWRFDQIARHVGFYIINNELYASVCDGSTHNKQLIETFTASYNSPKHYVLMVHLIPGVECRFYVDGTLRKAVTSNLPSGAIDAEYIPLYGLRCAETGTPPPDEKIKYLEVYGYRFLQKA